MPKDIEDLSPSQLERRRKNDADKRSVGQRLADKLGINKKKAAAAAAKAKTAAQSLAKKKSLRTVNPASKSRRSLVTTGNLKTVKRKTLSNVQRSAGAGIQVAK